MKNVINSFFNTKKTQTIPTIKKQYSIKDLETLSKINEIIKDDTIITKIRELNYEYINIDSKKYSCLNDLEDKTNKPITLIIEKTINDVVKKYHGFRFTYKNKEFDIFKENKTGLILIGKSKKANHQVFNMKNEYQGEILFIGDNKTYYEFIYDFCNHYLIEDILNKNRTKNFKANLENSIIEMLY